MILLSESEIILSSTMSIMIIMVVIISVLDLEDFHRNSKTEIN